ncbi:hypothetical protein J2W32_006534 [Variovorax boronicumulans]|uniref:Uncharacterized protein n=1 Tax=Variovorax boronicumulans TaxID=436515 RepID=A0AAW8DC07_9BURK|nr:aminoglycoside phosphotransferase [Variovorax boronicumulans]MDP9897401.1 hypothetical protein [Variovorax boronicumulans]MDQ0057457.1 hypothetical protein [Variovorax boronicumulans]
MPEEDPTIPMPAAPASNRALFQTLAERVGLLVPGASLSHQQIAFAEGVVELVKNGRLNENEK